ncbi:uncharacterized protein LACBIDRAFT_238721 [Laccaria bicolor S238N-H82]|uniref:Predicted protein n=1 Tax=Laccaria bicolor (strain S238N-H82 / ATCC MYA-4686) TaxID=486041 RepID=B0DQA6_LACBS|nr:uncharacterized protein LACBIDRAFT_238721 [Laccaria bicolor S238N-H82]EDR03350.1 predicted protein [Laccaria bicolor S238N-H82]|eukprot:XP_001886146.1 predicted protein [Laccaria bicolor S238N-H82]
MIQTGLIPNAHGDLVTDASYDFYGLRLATCSLDQRIKIWQLDEANGTWSTEDDWKAHDAAVSKISWAHPEFGSIIASSSFDRTVKVWEQAAPAAAADQQTNANAGGQSSSRWIERAVLPDARGTVRMVEFAPHHFGLKLASIASDSILRIHECLEQPSLTSWQLVEEIDVQTVADGGWCLSWCKDRYWGEVIAAGCGTSGTIKTSTAVETTNTPSSTAYAITSVAWAPLCGRSYHLIATGGRDGHVRIWKVKPGSDDAAEGDHEAAKWTAASVADFDHHKSAVGRVEWNITGTVLSSAGNDGRIRLWKATAGNVWRPAGSVGVEQATGETSTQTENKDVDMDT